MPLPQNFLQSLAFPGSFGRREESPQLTLHPANRLLQSCLPASEAPCWLITYPGSWDSLLNPRPCFIFWLLPQEPICHAWCPHVSLLESEQNYIANTWAPGALCLPTLFSAALTWVSFLSFPISVLCPFHPSDRPTVGVLLQSPLSGFQICNESMNSLTKISV